MNKYYVSQYVNVIDLENSALLFNGINGCMDTVSRKLGDSLRAKDTAELSFLSTQDMELLAKRGHLTTLPPETEWARFKEFAAALHSRRERQTTHGGIMLLMSYNCNLACKYCYQQEHRPHKSREGMTEKFVEALFERHISSVLPGIELKNTEISFYGGEPFLPANLPVIRKALSYAKRYGMSSRAISNATQVESMLDIFGAGPGKVNYVQVSLDGDRELHDKSRIPASGEGTFDRIVNNIALMLKQGAHVNIRLNLDRRTLASIPNLVKELKSRKILGAPNASIYASPLHDNVAEVDTTHFMDAGELSSKVFDLGIDMEHPVSLRANDMSYLFQLEKGLGLMQTSFCMQTIQNTLVVDPFGDLYGCFEEAGYAENRVGHISEGGVEFFPLRKTYKTRHIANMDECVKCPVALACGGQCGVRCRAVTGDLFKPNCDGIKNTILQGLKLAYEKRLKNGGGTPTRTNEAATRSVHG